MLVEHLTLRFDDERRQSILNRYNRLPNMLAVFLCCIHLSISYKNDCFG